jgi:hypothetical protein
MTPVARCLHQLDHASAVTDSTVTALVMAALDELEEAFVRPAECIVALEEVLHDVRDRVGTEQGPFGRFLVAMIDQRQGRLNRCAIT